MPPVSRFGRPVDVPDPVVVSPAQADALRRAQLDLLAEFDRVCAAHGLEFFALYGTLLGAVRHGGFIPWDDDLDVGMLRPDYDRLTELVDAGFGGEFFFQTVDSDPHYGCMFAKLRRNDTRCVDRISFGSPQHGGVFVDVFPLDVKATTRWGRREQKIMRYVGFRLLYLKAGYLFMRGTSVSARIVQTIARVGIRLMPRRLVIALTERHTRLGRTDGSAPREYVSLFGAYVYERDTVDAAWIHPIGRLPFEDMTIPAFADADAYLTQIYGDYMTPPPAEQQAGHHEIVELDLGRYAP